MELKCAIHWIYPYLPEFSCATSVIPYPSEPSLDHCILSFPTAISFLLLHPLGQDILSLFFSTKLLSQPPLPKLLPSWLYHFSIATCGFHPTHLFFISNAHLPFLLSILSSHLPHTFYFSMFTCCVPSFCQLFLSNSRRSLPECTCSKSMYRPSTNALDLNAWIALYQDMHRVCCMLSNLDEMEMI